jgi:hypothetical protein
VKASDNAAGSGRCASGKLLWCIMILNIHSAAEMA